LTVSNWIRDEHGQIKIPTPDYGAGTGRKTDLGLGGAALNAQAHGPQQISGLAIGLGAVAGAADQWAVVLAEQERQKQKLEALDWTQAYQDKERDKLAQMAQLKSKAGVDQAVAFMKEFYETENPKLLERARGNFQKNFLSSFLAHSRDAGLNRAYAHQIQEFETYQGQVWAGETAGTMAQIEADPENYEIYLARLDRLDANMNPGDDPIFREAKSRQRRDLGLEVTIVALTRAGKYDEAEALWLKTFGAPKTDGGLTWPVAGNPGVSSGFGSRAAPVEGASTDHGGVDIPVPVGTPVLASGDGVFTFVGTTEKGGNTITIDHGKGLTTSYCHLSSLGEAKAGQTVGMGEQIALSGGAKGAPGSGVSTGPHLHFAIRQNGRAVDPTKILAGYSPAKGDVLRKKIQDMKLEQEKRAADQGVAIQYQGLKDQVSGLPFDEWDANFRNRAAEISDHGLREYYLKLWDQDLSAEKDRRAANDQAAFGKYLEEADAQGWTLSQKIAGMEAIRENMTPEGWAARRKQLVDGSINRETLGNIKAKNELLRRIDLRPDQEGAINSEQQIDAFAEEYGLTLSQWKDGKEYLDQGGKGGHIKFSTVESLYKKLADTKKDLPEGFYEAVLELAPDGQRIGEQELRGIVATVIMQGEVKGGGIGYGRDRTYFEAWKNGQAGTWLPDVTSKERKEYIEEMKAAGITDPTDKEIRLFKKHEIMGVPKGQ